MKNNMYRLLLGQACNPSIAGLASLKPGTPVVSASKNLFVMNSRDWSQEMEWGAN